MGGIELLKSGYADKGKTKYIIFDHNDNSLKGVIDIDNTPYILNIEQCYKLTMSDGSITYIDDIAEVITSYGK